MATTTSTDAAKSAAAKTTATKTTAVIQAVGKAACKKYGLAKVYVTADGAAFKQLNDAKNYAKTHGDISITTVEK